MRTVTIHEAKTHLSRLIKAVLDGEEVLIARGKQPVARLVPIVAARPRRTLGGAEGRIELGPDFDAPLEDFADYQ